MAESHGPYPGVIQERRARLVVETPEGSAELTGKPDWYDAERRYLEDWKSCKSVPTAPQTDHQHQLNIYALLIEKGRYDPQGDPTDILGPFKVETAAIRYIDHERGPAIPVELWSTECVERFVRSRMTPLVRFQKTGELPQPMAPGSGGWWKARWCPLIGSGNCCVDMQGA